MSGYRLTPNARLSLISIVQHVDDQFGSAIARAVVDDLEEALERLAENPRIGHRRGDLTKDDTILFWPVGPALIAYRAQDAGIDVLFIERAGFDWEQRLH